MTVSVLAVASEFFPVVKTGGLADVTAALPAALRTRDVRTATLLPGYPAVMSALASRAEEVLDLPSFFGGDARVRAGRVGEDIVFALDAPHLFDRPGNPYLGPDGRDWPDNGQRFAALGLAAARIGMGQVPGFVPDLVHAHDWQGAPALVQLAHEGSRRPALVMTVHNLAYQGRFPADLLGEFRLPDQSFGIGGMEFYGDISFLKGGLQYADRITTVSPTYAREILTPEFGCGLEGVLKSRESVLHGIVNGIDVAVWNPQTDRSIAARYDARRIADRAPNKAALQWRFGLSPEPERMLLAVVSRLSWQKGLDLLADSVTTLLDAGAQLAVLGSGDSELEERFRGLSMAHPGRIGCVIGYDEGLAHQLQAGADALLVPSRFEPCGLTQLCALRYGAVPIVARVGGLADTVADIGGGGWSGGQSNGGGGRSGGGGGVGIQFHPVTRPALEDAIRRAADLWADRSAWARVQANGMAQDVSWDASAAAYADLYRACLTARA